MSIIEKLRDQWFMATPNERADLVIGVLVTASIFAIVAYEAWRMTA